VAADNVPHTGIEGAIRGALGQKDPRAPNEEAACTDPHIIAFHAFPLSPRASLNTVKSNDARVVVAANGVHGDEHDFALHPTGIFAKFREGRVGTLSGERQLALPE